MTIARTFVRPTVREVPSKRTTHHTLAYGGRKRRILPTI